MADEKDQSQVHSAASPPNAQREHHTVGDALFAVADAANRAAPSMRRGAQVLTGVIAVTAVLTGVVVAGTLIYTQFDQREREAQASREADAARDAEARTVKQRRAVLDLLEPGLVPILCPVPGELIGRQAFLAEPADVRLHMEGCSNIFGQDCEKSGPHGCTPATESETAAWERALSSAPPEKRLAIARRAVVAVDPNPRIAVLDSETGQIYSVDRSELNLALREHPSYTPATPAQIAAWRSVP